MKFNNLKIISTYLDAENNPCSGTKFYTVSIVYNLPIKTHFGNQYSKTKKETSGHSTINKESGLNDQKYFFTYLKLKRYEQQ